jgi:hypothetical protein
MPVKKMPGLNVTADDKGVIEGRRVISCQIQADPQLLYVADLLFSLGETKGISSDISVIIRQAICQYIEAARRAIGHARQAMQDELKAEVLRKPRELSTENIISTPDAPNGLPTGAKAAKSKTDHVNLE